jgi:surfactin synthase thioesterase subunit
MHVCVLSYNFTDIFRFLKVSFYYPSPALIFSGDVDWIHVAQDRGQWLTCKRSKETSDSIKAKHFYLGEKLLVSQKRVCSMGLVTYRPS